MAYALALFQESQLKPFKRERAFYGLEGLSKSFISCRFFKEQGKERVGFGVKVFFTKSNSINNSHLFSFPNPT